MRILIVTPFADANGAEKMLWYVLKNADRQKFSFALYTYRKGNLLKDLPADVPFVAFPAHKTASGPATGPARLWLKIRNKTMYYLTGRYPAGKTPVHPIEALHREFKPDLWYINTLHMGPVAALAARLNVPYVVHFHELLYLYGHSTYEHLQSTIRTARLLVGCAQCVCDKLAVMGGTRIALQYECTEARAIAAGTGQPGRAGALRRELGIAPGAYVWVMPGAIDIRKGTDLVVEVARLLGDRVAILCLGSSRNGFGYYIEREIEYYGLRNVRITGFRTDDYHEYLRMADGVLLASREDPFPLVMIEGAAAGKPIVAFNSGGVREFVQPGMGIVVDSWRVEDLAAAMLRVMDGGVDINRDVLVARALEFDAAAQTRKWETMMLTHFGGASQPAPALAVANEK